MTITENVHHGTAGEVFRAFLKLGVTSFGGPIAHLGYFRDELVIRRKWIDEDGYADLVALCQFLPGPASSQVGFALGPRDFALAVTGFLLLTVWKSPPWIVVVLLAAAATALSLL